MLPEKEMYPFEKNNNNKPTQKLFKISFLKHSICYMRLFYWKLL